MRQPVTLRAVISLLGIATLVLTSTLAFADITPPPPPFSGKCDFLTGGGFIYPNGTDKGNFGVGGGCKKGSGTNDVPYWGHLEFHDHGVDLNVHMTAITAYFPEGTTGTDPQTGQPTGTRWICGTARTDQFGDVDFAVRVTDAGERVRHSADPGRHNRLFDLRLLRRHVPQVGRWRRRGRQHPAPRAQQFDHGDLRRDVRCWDLTSVARAWAVR